MIRKSILLMLVIAIQSSCLCACFGEVLTSRQVFLDGRFIQDPSGVELVVNQPRLDREQLLVSEYPWEDAMIGAYTSVIQEGGRIKLWYESRDQAGTWSMAYAYSDDGGSSFVKPTDLGAIEYQGSTANNLVLTGGLGHHVFLMGPEAPASEKYGCLRHVDGGWPDYTPGTNRLFVSPDGINWTPKGIVPFLYEGGIQPTDSQNVTFWDTRLEKYVCYPRLFSPDLGGRAVGRYEGDTLESFPREPAPVVLQTDPDAYNHELYTSAVVQYPYADDAYYAYPAMFAGGDSYLYVRFNASRDGIDWPRMGDMPIVIAEGFDRNGTTIPMEDGSIYAGYGMTHQGDEVSIYYTTLPAGHVYPPPPNSGIITRATYRLDGLMSVDAGAAPGQFTTPVMQLDSNQLAINFKGEAGGWVDVEILDMQGNSLPGFGSAQVDRCTGDSVSMPLSWNGSTDVSSLQGMPVQLKFTMSDGKLYGFQGASEYEGSIPTPPKSFTHTGTNNPSSEGWSTYIIGGSSYAGTDEMDHWEIASAAPHAFKADGLADPDAYDIVHSPNGWHFEATVKVVEPLNSVNTVMMRVADNQGDPAAADMSTRGAWGDVWMMNLMTDPDPSKTGIWIQVNATGDDAVFLAAVDITEYHTYGMIMTRGATMQEDYVEYTLDGAGIGTITRAEAYNMQYWRSFVADGWDDCTWGRTTGSPEVNSVARWNAVEFSERGLGADLPGDANSDGKVDAADAAALAANWLKADGAIWSQGDFNGDGSVDGADAAILAANWQVGAGSSVAVPEPSSFILLLGLLAAFLLCYRC